jgi:NADPH-dependent 2,4-dienoyl-CoA reductase/sulfur reductase-like enzyme/rhodanese-related sulfurtransferase
MSAPRTVVIVGGVAGGMSTATRLRRNDEHVRIVVVERGEHVSFANCGLPYYVGGVISDREELLLQTPESLNARFDLDVRVRTEAIAIDRDARTVTLRNLADDSVEQLHWDSLVLSPGASPFVPPIPGIERALTLRDVTDVDRMAAAVADAPATAVVLGGGFIGLEVAENLHHRGIDTTIVELADQVLAPLDPELAQDVADHLESHDIQLRLGVAAAALTEDSVELSDGTTIPADLVIAAIGVRPETALARDAGIELDERGGILVDGSQRTSDPNIYAVGDAATKRDALTGDPVLVPLAQTANRHGRLVADVLSGRTVTSLPVFGTAVVGVLDMVVAVTGWNEKRLVAAGRSHRIIHTHPPDHARYYPGSQDMSLKLLVDPDTDRILGAQGVGGNGVDKRIDVIATAMRGGITASELADLELAYAPQFGSAKDPVNMLGFVADNLAAGVVRTVQWHELETLVDAGAFVLDVRDADERADGAIPGSMHVPVDELRARLDELPRDRRIVAHCEVGVRSNVAARLLDHAGFDVVNLDGGYCTWRAGTRSRRGVEPVLA